MFKFFAFLIPLFLSAQTLLINDLRTNLYSKDDAQTLKKIELSLEIQTDANISKAKVVDSVNVIISSFFYEDIFTEIGKLNFKKTLEKFIEKKYKVKVDDVYILSLNSVENFDIEEFKRFIKDNEDENTTKDKIKELKTMENNVSLNDKKNNKKNNLTIDIKNKEQNLSKKENNESMGFDIKMSEENNNTNLEQNNSLKQLENLIKDLNSSN